jgi:hypothetical protein
VGFNRRNGATAGHHPSHGQVLMNQCGCSQHTTVSDRALKTQRTAGMRPSHYEKRNQRRQYVKVSTSSGGTGIGWRRQLGASFRGRAQRTERRRSRWQEDNGWTEKECHQASKEGSVERLELARCGSQRPARRFAQTPGRPWWDSDFDCTGPRTSSGAILNRHFVAQIRPERGLTQPDYVRPESRNSFRHESLVEYFVSLRRG